MCGGRAGSVGAVILRPTPKAARLLGGQTIGRRRGLLPRGRKRALLARRLTAFPILVVDIRVAQLRPLGHWLASTITANLAGEHLPADAGGRVGGAGPLIVRSASRQLLGFMNGTAFRADIEISHAGGLSAPDLAELNYDLRRHLHNYNGRYATPAS